jgi:uncharacterized protein YciI
MEKRFVFCYQMTEDAATIRETVPAHVTYWTEAALDHYLGGPFADRSGGLITFAASDLERATRIAESDPFVLRSLVRDWWIREWLVETPSAAGADAR